MFIRFFKCLLVVCATLLFVSCSATRPKTADEGPVSQVPLKQDAEYPHSLVYKKNGVDFKKYTKFMIEPVAIYKGKDAQFKNVSESDRQMIADLLYSEHVRQLKNGYEVVNQAGPNVLRIKFTLAGIQMTQTTLATITHLAPVGIVMNLGRSASGMTGSFTGTVTYAGELHDGETGELVASFLTKRGPLAIDITKSFKGIDAAKQAVKDCAERFKEIVDKIQGKKD
ncbi:MAG: DUF3313 domain-containing protein [Verrucomicrobiae bacterium]|nr:DUF3313 domain-containing protein [Verrucomicrobiae bacterium]